MLFFRTEDFMSNVRRALRAPALLVLAVSALLLGSASLSALPGNEKMLTVSGNVAKLEAANRAVTVKTSDGPDTRFVWTNETKINGTLAVGAKVTIRYTSLPDGQNLAHQISVSKG
jgi:hypothetical protein